MSSDDIRRNDFRHGNFRCRADAVRSIPLETVLLLWGANRDRRDRNRWRTARGLLSIRGAKFFNWHQEIGGGGAIDLVMHLGDMDVQAAVAWLEIQFGSPSPEYSPEKRLGAERSSRPSRSQNRPSPEVDPTSAGSSLGRHSHLTTSCSDGHALRLPVPDASQLERVRCYLSEQRRLWRSSIEPLIEAGKIYADRRGNAIFLMVAGQPQRPTGAELRGTGQKVWRGLASGTRKDAGYFWVGQAGASKIVICESAIDAISCFQLHVAGTLPAEDRLPPICISTAGVRSNPPWLRHLIARGYDICCGFDADHAGSTASRQMIAQHPSIKRLCPPAHDWNDALRRS